MNKDLEYLYNTPAGKQWEQIGIKHHHGINVPLFSLHSQNSCGIGEFPDLLPLIDWCSTIGFDVIQLLPINDTGPQTSPYSALSAYALNPIYLGLSALPHLTRYPNLQEKLKDLQALTAAPRVDHAKVLKEKDLFLREYFKVERSEITSQPEYQQFLQNNSWLPPYALFRTLKEKNNWLSWQLWPVELSSPTKNTFDGLLKQFADDVEYIYFTQFLCFSQMTEVKKHADLKGVFLKGDIPILISRESADVWTHRSFFNSHYSAGAPPDMYSEMGQNWDFPIYNWEELEKEHFHWWKERVKVAENLYHLYRIDHVVGFFRIWAIAPGLSGKEGKFLPADESSWIPLGNRILKAILESSTMLPIAEDLGTVPPEIRTTLRELGICGTRVIRWERYWDKPEQPYIPFDQYLPESMTTVSTHDSETLFLWWNNQPHEAQIFARDFGWCYNDHLSREHHQDFLWDSHHTTSLFHINLLNEYFSLVPGLAWHDPLQDRINLPGIISDNNWTYRFKPSIEQFTTNTTLSNIMLELSK